jgi:adenylate kinase
MNPKTYVFFGNVGAGKGTQVELLKKHYTDLGQKVVHFSPGAEYRTITASGSYSADVIKNTMNQGLLLPDVLTSGMFTSQLLRELDGAAHHFTDGYPRSIQQAEDFVTMMDFYGRSNIELIYIDVTKEEAIARMKLRGRADDTDEGIATRFDVYEKSVLPALEILKQKGYALYHVNGQQTVDEVFAEIKKVLGL